MSTQKRLREQDKEYILTRVWERSTADASAEVKKFDYYFKRYDDLYPRLPTFFRDSKHKDIADLARTRLLETKECCVQQLARLRSWGSPGHADLDRSLWFIIGLFFALDRTMLDPTGNPQSF